MGQQAVDEEVKIRTWTLEKQIVYIIRKPVVLHVEKITDSKLKIVEFIRIR